MRRYSGRIDSASSSGRAVGHVEARAVEGREQPLVRVEARSCRPGRARRADRGARGTPPPTRPWAASTCSHGAGGRGDLARSRPTGSMACELTWCRPWPSRGTAPGRPPRSSSIGGGQQVRPQRVRVVDVDQAELVGAAGRRPGRPSPPTSGPRSRCRRPGRSRPAPARTRPLAGRQQGAQGGRRGRVLDDPAAGAASTGTGRAGRAARPASRARASRPRCRPGRSATASPGCRGRRDTRSAEDAPGRTCWPGSRRRSPGDCQWVVPGTTTRSRSARIVVQRLGVAPAGAAAAAAAPRPAPPSGTHRVVARPAPGSAATQSTTSCPRRRSSSGVMRNGRAPRRLRHVGSASAMGPAGRSEPHGPSVGSGVRASDGPDHERCGPDSAGRPDARSPTLPTADRRATPRSSPSRASPSTTSCSCPAESSVLPAEVVDLAPGSRPGIELAIPIVSAAMDTVTEAPPRHRPGPRRRHRHRPPQPVDRRPGRRGRQGQALPVGHDRRPGHAAAPTRSVTDALDAHGALPHLGRADHRRRRPPGRPAHQPRPALHRRRRPAHRQRHAPSRRSSPPRSGTTLEQAKDILWQHRIEKLPIVDDEGFLQGLITVKDIKKQTEYPDATQDEQGRLRVGAAVGVGPDALERAERAGRRRGRRARRRHRPRPQPGVLDVVKQVKGAFDIEVIAGNVATAEARRRPARRRRRRGQGRRRARVDLHHPGRRRRRRARRSPPSTTAPRRPPATASPSSPTAASSTRATWPRPSPPAPTR